MKNGNEVQTLRQAVDESISDAVKSGAIDPTRSAAPIAMLRAMADLIDEDTGSTPAMRYVTPASFLSYCEALGLLPNEGQRERVQASEPNKLEALISSSKFANSAHRNVAL